MRPTLTPTRIPARNRIIGRWKIALLGIAALLAGPVLADHDRHGNQYDNRYYDSQVRIYPAHSSHRKQYQRRGDYRPFRQRDNRRSYQQYRYYPRANGHRAYQQPYGQRRYNNSGNDHHDHYHRNRPLLRILQDIERYLHCEAHGGYFLRQDLYYY